MRILILALALISGCSEGNHASPIFDLAVSFKQIGDACKADVAPDSECGDPPQFYCGTSVPNGSCLAACNTDLDCPSGSVCVGAGDMMAGACHKSCKQDSDCRAGEKYSCKQSPSDAAGPYCDAKSSAGDGGA